MYKQGAALSPLAQLFIIASRWDLRYTSKYKRKSAKNSSLGKNPRTNKKVLVKDRQTERESQLGFSYVKVGKFYLPSYTISSQLLVWEPP
jgi:hypothetical protein